MKTNEWLSYFVEQHQAAFVAGLEAEMRGRGFAPPAGAATELATALIADFEAESAAASQPALRALAVALCAQNTAGAGAALAAIWQKAEQLLGTYIAGEAELSGGARRLAYLRLSEFGVQARGALHC
ncbi:MAG: hypothetical protein ACR2MO_09280 [Acidimicrobiales bacterium]